MRKHNVNIFDHCHIARALSNFHFLTSGQGQQGGLELHVTGHNSDIAGVAHATESSEQLIPGCVESLQLQGGQQEGIELHVTGHNWDICGIEHDAESTEQLSPLTVESVQAPQVVVVVVGVVLVVVVGVVVMVVVVGVVVVVMVVGVV